MDDGVMQSSLKPVLAGFLSYATMFRFPGCLQGSRHWQPVEAILKAKQVSDGSPECKKMAQVMTMLGLPPPRELSVWRGVHRLVENHGRVPHVLTGDENCAWVTGRIGQGASARPDCSC